MGYGKRLRDLRAGRSQSEVASALGVAQTTVSSWETEERAPKDQQKIMIAKYYNTTVADIFFTQEQQ